MMMQAAPIWRPPIRLGLLVMLAVIGLVLSLPAYAQRHDGQPRDARPRDARDFHGRDFNRFNRHERDVWRGGAWRRDWHDGRFAWWWVLGNSWYFYPQPVYPFPTYVPPAVVAGQAPPMPAGLPPAQFWYFCDNPQGYYPYVASCSGPWREVPATPPK